MIDIGSVVNGKYRLVRILGDGGMGSVYEATHAVLGIRVAIKVLHPELVRRTGLVERFLQEARVVAQIRSPHVVQVIDVDRTPDGHAYIVMELLEGEPLSSVVDRQRKLPVSTACEYTVQILEALEAAHALGVVHRDLKPENVFVTFAGGRPVLKLIDFGIAKARRLDPRQKNLTVAGVVMGTAEYMAPEQARSADMVDPRADLYAVGVMLYEMIAGARPVRGDTGEDARVIALKVERGEIIPLVQAAPHAPRDVAGLVHHAMAARPEMRFATATEMRLALEGAMTGKRPPTKALSQPATTGTAAMGATGHVRTAASPAVTGANLEEPHVDTVRAAPVATAMAAPAYLGAGMAPLAPAEGPHPRQQPRRIPIAALLGLSLLLGASVLGILVGTGTIAFSSGPPAPPPLVAPASVPTLPTPTATPAATTAPAAPALPTLAPTRPVPTTPRPVPSNRPAPEADAGAPPFVLPTALPTTLPPFPSVFPLPAGFPSTLPSGFPSIPGWPTIQLPQPPQPAKQAAPSGSASY